MTLFWLSLGGCLAVVALVAGWLAQQKRARQNDEWLHSVLLSDREVQQIRQWFEREARERQEQAGE